ncbi:hypothetical protein AOLI_G00314780 [Acnodon oligacanthus]
MQHTAYAADHHSLRISMAAISTPCCSPADPRLTGPDPSAPWPLMGCTETVEGIAQMSSSASEESAALQDAAATTAPPAAPRASQVSSGSIQREDSMFKGTSAAQPPPFS